MRAWEALDKQVGTALLSDDLWLGCCRKQLKSAT